MILRLNRALLVAFHAPIVVLLLVTLYSVRRSLFRLGLARSLSIFLHILISSVVAFVTFVLLTPAISPESYRSVCVVLRYLKMSIYHHSPKASPVFHSTGQSY